MRIKEVINETRYKGYNQQQIDVAKSNLDARELNLLKQYKEELIAKLEMRGISPDLVGRGVATDPQENLPLQTKLAIYREQCKAIKDRLASDTKSFVQPGAEFQQQKKKMKQMSGPVTTMTGDEFMRMRGAK